MSNFDASTVNGLVGLWDFRNGAELSDTGLDDGVAQNGWLHGNANISGDRLHLDGHGDYFEVDGEIIGGSHGDSPNVGDDDPFDMSAGTLEIQFNQDAHVGSSPDTLVSRGEYADRGSEGYFELAIQADGSIYVIHCADGADIWKMSTAPNIANPGDTVNVKYTWDEATGVQLEVENLTTGATETVSSDTTGLTMEIGDNDDESWQIGVRESDDGTYNHFFDGSIDYMAIYEEEAVNGPVDGTNGDDIMLPGFVDAQNDTIDGADGDDDTVFGYDGDDVIAGGEGTNTLFGGSGDDVFIGGDGADNFQGNAGQDNLDYSNSDAAVNVNLDTGALSGGDADNDSIIGGIDGVIGSDFDDTLVGFDQQGTTPADTFSNQLFGGAGEDYIEGQGGDDLLDGGADDDEIYGGDGADEITGGTGADYIEGGADDDVIYGGDNGAGGTTTVRESLEWNEAPGFTNNGAASGFTQNTGNVDVTFSILNETGSASTEWETDNQNVSDIDGDGNAIDDNSSLYSVLNGNGNDADYALDFSDEVENVSFRINDIDGDGVVNVKAYDEDGNQIEISMVGGSDLTLLDTDGVAGVDTADSNGGYAADTSADYSVLVRIPGPVARIVIEHDQNGGDNTGINVTDVYFDATVADPADEGDTIFGGDGDDIIFGEAGGDIIDGGEGADQISGGADADRINVVSAADGIGDVVDGGFEGDDNDTLDLTNVGPFRIINETTDPDGNSTSGTVEFLDPTTGDVLGTMDFAEIENILGDPVALDGTVSGTDGNDVIDVNYTGDPDGDMIDNNDAVVGNAGSNDDIVEAGDGNDTVFAGQGNDTVFGGEGNDSIDGGSGNDTLMGDEGDDRIFGNAGNDEIFGGDGNDNLGGADSGDDTYYGGDGNDMVEASFGDDTLFGGEGNDDLWASADDDLVYGGEGDDQSYGGHGQDTVYGDAGNDTLSGGSDSDTVFGGTGNDVIQGGGNFKDDTGPDAANTLYGGNDRDTFLGATDGDIVDGGAGGDDYDVLDLTGEGPFRVVNEVPDSNGNGTDGTIEFLDADGNVTGTLEFTEIEEIIGDRIDPDGTVHGTDGNDVINPGFVDPQGDTVDGDDGDDDIIEAGDGDDVVNAGEGDDTVFGGEGADSIDGGNGDDVLNGENGDDTIRGRDGEDTLDGGDGDDRLFGGGDNDSITGGDGSDDVFGGAGDDVIDTSGPGSNNLLDPEGNPDEGYPGVYPSDDDPNNDLDTVDGGGGDDIITTGDDNDSIIGGAGEDTIYAGFDDDTVDGGNDDDLIVGSEGNDEIRGGQGNDVIYGGLETTDILDIPDDVDLLPDNNTDTLYGGNGNDTIYGRDDDDLIYGDTGNDVLFGGIDDDTLYGGQGNDTFEGGEGEDQQFGGNDRDTFNVLSAADGIGDVVDGGSEGVDEDTLDLSNVGDFQIINQTLDADGDSTSGTVQFLDADGNVTGEMEFSEIESILGTGGPDGTVHGTAGDDVMNPGFIDTQGDTIDGDDGDNDIIEAGDGNDLVNAGNGDDTVFGGDGNDTLSGNDGDDTLYGEDGNDRLFGGDGFDTLFGGAGDDTLSGNRDGDQLFGGEGNDTLNGDIAADTLDGGNGDDLLRGENGDDLIFGGDGSDTADGGDGNDTIDTSGPGSDDLLDPTGNPDQGYPGIFPGDDDPFNDMDTVFGGGGSDTITTGDDDDSIDGGAGNDTIYAGFDDDTIDGGDGDDLIVGGEGNDEIEGGLGNDVIYGGLEGIDVLDIPDAIDLVPTNGLDTVFGGEGNDTIFGADDDDVLHGDEGNDVLFGGIDDDTLFGGTGSDQFTGGEGSDEQYGGADADTFTITSTEDAIGDSVDGGSDGDDNDTLNLTGVGPFQIINETVDADGNSTSGTIQFLDAPGGTVVGELEFSEIETIVPCFTPGTLIATMTGEKLVEDLKVGDRVITRDNGAQEIRWLGNKPMSGAQLQANPHLQPVLVRKGSLGGGLPERDMLVSPNHRMLINNAEVGLLFNEPEVLVAAKHLINADKGIVSVAASQTNYIHFMFDHHEVVLSNGAWTESFQPGDQAMAGVSQEQRSEIVELFPELAHAEGREAFASSRLSLKAFEAKMLK
ncbi:Hint domain-containing protein [Amylibacter sp. IMCC11727]|uniref:Hint domain-containing protein n=1 Tax=Amylibacter sp. IMCC11727 TaxID=3039851 RepID=UPI00244DF273|nr:Hint domain-containing protein [Amylibacter sp. IMCC11727]WGI22653.1 Hint domain-containing protein [Amylibacter sp. IMCC11727]